MWVAADSPSTSWPLLVFLSSAFVQFSYCQSGLQEAMGGFPMPNLTLGELCHPAEMAVQMGRSLRELFPPLLSLSCWSAATSVCSRVGLRWIIHLSTEGKQMKQGANSSVSKGGWDMFKEFLLLFFTLPPPQKSFFLLFCFLHSSLFQSVYIAWAASCWACLYTAEENTLPGQFQASDHDTLACTHSCEWGEQKGSQWFPEQNPNLPMGTGLHKKLGLYRQPSSHVLPLGKSCRQSYMLLLVCSHLAWQLPTRSPLEVCSQGLICHVSCPSLWPLWICWWDFHA